ncbi:MAG TPA: hypothetical protein EYH54_03995 [Nautiliaceae bacterium]|nr:hypothetical protein [Nautiliaceae bacterium]
MEKVIKIETDTKVLIPYGDSLNSYRKINDALDFYLEIKEFEKKNKEYLLSQRLGRFEIFKYSKKAFWDFTKRKINILRTPLLYCRGHVFDYYTYSFVTVPFPKFFSLNETPKDSFSYIIENILPSSEEMVIMEKMNGFLVNISRTFDNELLITSSGSLEGPYVEIAKRNLERFIGKDYEEKLKNIIPKGYTIMTELIAPEDYFNHIVAKADQFGFYLLAYSFDYKNKHPKDAKILPFFEENKLFNNLVDLGFKKTNFEIKEPDPKNFELEVRKSLEQKDKEGVVIYFLKNNKAFKFLKIKYKDYLIKKAKKRGYLKKLKYYEELNFEKIKKFSFDI